MKEAPYAFGSSFEGEKDRTEPDWRNAVNSRTRFVAEVQGEVVGMAAGGGSGYSGTASLTSLWVDPTARGMGVGDALVVAVIGWAVGAGNDDLLLWVVDGNEHAEKLYERHGFRRTGAAAQLRPGEDTLEYEMSLALSPRSSSTPPGR